MFARKLSFTALALVLVAIAGLARADDATRGSWTISQSEQAGKVMFALMQNRPRHRWNSESDWPLTAFTGLDVSPARHDVKFAVIRDAGRFDCSGYLEAGEGAGTFQFTANPDFVRDMAAIGFTDIDAEKQMAMAVHDVSVAFAREMKAQKLSRFDTDKLIAFRIFDVDSRFIRELRAEGLAANDADKLVAFRVHGVTPEIVRDLRKAGLQLTEDQLIAFRVHGVSPEFVSKVEELGYENPNPDQLVSMKIFGVTPEFITGLRARGLKDLTIDKLVQLKVHGID
ncbi:MAG TPA: hypothetical protein VMF52_03420 [Steroidobacteraceae bacterium]|nr:hypothetical protein [Steroidobacteraceae bacterium]